MFSSEAATSLILLLLGAFTPVNAQTAQPDGTIVPFTSQLPVCASLCGPLFDVQGGCLTGDTNACFCANAKLTPITTGGTAAVSTICGPKSCTATADLQKIATWYNSFCGKSTTGATTTAATGTGSNTAASTGSTDNNVGNGSPTPAAHGSWFSTHWKWIVMLVILIFVIVGGWIGACIWRRSYLRKRERQFEMRPPAVPWVPAGPEVHMSGAHDKGKGIQSVYGPGVGMNAGAGAGANAGGHLKEMRGAINAPPPPATDPEKGGKRGWLRKKR